MSPPARRLMPHFTGRLVLLLLAAALLLPAQARGQETPATQPAKSLKKAFLLSLVVPGLGHRYVNEGWNGAASLFAIADAGLWLGLFGTQWQYNQTVQSYETLAAGGAAALVEGKDRRFFLNLATYRSSDAYLEIQLRNRAWDQIDYVSERAFQWRWETEADFQRFRDLREKAESLDRRTPILLTMLVANRLLAAVTAIRAANRVNSPPAKFSFSLEPPPPHSEVPLMSLYLRL